MYPLSTNGPPRIARTLALQVLVVGNPANTNALIAAKCAPSIPRENFTALTRLDHNRAAALLAKRTSRSVSEVDKVCIWGNHSATQYPDVRFATVAGAGTCTGLEEGTV